MNCEIFSVGLSHEETIGRIPIEFLCPVIEFSEWISNSSEFLKLLPEAETVRGNVVKTFGIPWNYTEDYLQVGGINFNDENISPTKRGILKVLAKIFDPLGLITPVTFFGKVFLQEL